MSEIKVLAGPCCCRRPWGRIFLCFLQCWRLYACLAGAASLQFLPVVTLCSLLCGFSLISLCLSIVRVRRIAFKAQLDNPGSVSLLEILNHTCKDPVFYKSSNIHRFLRLGCGRIFKGPPSSPLHSVNATCGGDKDDNNSDNTDQERSAHHV